MFTVGHSDLSSEDDCNFAFILSEETQYHFVYPYFALISCTIIVFYLRVWFIVRKQTRQISEATKGTSDGNKKTKKLTKNLIIIVSIFLATYIPWIVGSVSCRLMQS